MSKASILRAIDEVLTGTIGSVRTVTAGTTRAGAWEGISDEKLAADALVKTRFEVIPLGEGDTGEIAPNTANLAIDSITVRIRIAFLVEVTTGELDDAARRVARAAIWDLVVQCRDALTYAGNLTQDSTAVATDLVGHALIPVGETVFDREDWAKRILVASFVMKGSINRTRAVA